MNVPNFSAAPVVCVSVIGAMTVAVAEPVAVAVLPAANAGVAEAAAATAARRMIFFMSKPLIEYSPRAPRKRGCTERRRRSRLSVQPTY